ncbi:MAG: ribonuclease Y [Candidatus Latescibacterota bacterium]|nr:MAG: ribonuclease Y [Candidatus Latescibacterota bacterium]RKY73999.1 MAG: ribonuclease Y [Candidatus Latescibacterota bacterium]HDH99936.1 ribonuclease Y [Bacillota bacterium]
MLIVYALIGAVVGFIAGWILNERVQRSRVAGARALAEQIVEDARKEAETVREKAKLEAENELHKARERFERESAQRRAELQQLEAKLLDQERKLDRKVDLLSRKEGELRQLERELKEKERAVQAKDAQLSELIKEQISQLERISGMTAEEAKTLLIAKLEQKAKQEAAYRAKEIKDRAIAEAEKEAREIVGMAIQRYAAEQAVESTVSVVSLPSDEMKGRIIGREGRNIRTFETLTGVDVIVDDTPEAVILSGFDSLRREIARIALERLIADGRIHPARIEEVVEKTKQDIDKIIQEAGEQAAYEVGVHGLHPRLLYYLGRLKFRTSFGQNVLQHSKEVAWLAGMMAGELGLDEVLARRAGLLHDIGKAADHEMMGSHTEIGMELARRYGEGPVVQNAIAGHHEGVPPISVITSLVAAADAISSARPGARRETLESYIRRLERLEELADSFPGVEKAYAIQAGREIRVMVRCEQVDDAQAEQLASDIAERVEKEVEYPGQIKVTVIREKRAVAYAK